MSWSSWTVGDKEVLERVQRRALRMVSNLQGRTYEARLAEVGMTSLEDRRVRGDMITTYRIMTGKDKVDPGLFFDLVADGQGPRTRGVTGVYNIRAVNDRLEIRRNFFSQRVVNTWNSLPASLKGVGTVLGFKTGYNEWVSRGRLGA